MVELGETIWRCNSDLKVLRLNQTKSALAARVKAERTRKNN